MRSPIQENKMGTTPIFKLIMSMSLPAMFSMLVQSLYNIVDSVFVDRPRCIDCFIPCFSDTDAYDCYCNWNRRWGKLSGFP